MSVTDYLKHKNIFITGGSGFIGKALIEKILRTIPDCGNIYFLLRPKKGKTPEERLKTVLENKIFDTLRKNNPDFLKKIVFIEGDIQQPKLGISEENKKILIENVDIIYHSAASIRFDDPLLTSILTNVRSTREIIELALEAKHLKAFVHVSTAYSNSDKRVVEEKLYPSFGDWREAIRLAEEGERNITNYLTEKYIHPLTNTYVYAKSLAEHVVNDMCRGKIPAVIVRPSIVTNALVEPFPGWTDNLNGPLGLSFAGASGIVRTGLFTKETYIDAVPVDAVVNCLILVAVESLKNPSTEEIKVFNNSKHYNYQLDFGTMDKLRNEVMSRGPINELIWFPNHTFVKSRLQYRFLAMLYHILPAILIDGLLRISGKKPRLFQIQKKIFIAQLVLEPFMTKTWTFKNEKAMALEKILTEEEVPIFGVIEKIILVYTDAVDYLANCCIGIQKYLLQQEVNLEKNKKKLKRFWMLSTITRILFYIFLIWIVLRTDVHGVLYKRAENYMTSL